MRYLLLILIVPCALIFPATAGAITGDSARFDYVLGDPSVISDNTLPCNDQQTVRYGFVLGAPAVLFDTTSQGCISTSVASTSIYQATGGSTIIRGGKFIIK